MKSISEKKVIVASYNVCFCLCRFSQIWKKKKRQEEQDVYAVLKNCCL